MSRRNLHRSRKWIPTTLTLVVLAVSALAPVSGAGASVTSKVIAGIVDVNVTLGYENATAAATGMVLTSTGEVLTNNHVIRDATAIKVRDVANAKNYTATVVGYDVAADIAVLQLKGATGLRTVPVGNSSSVRVGAKVTGIGNAGGTGGTPSSASGSVTALNQSITASDEAAGTSERLAGLIETNAPIEPGDSGGPLADASGNVIGMDTAASSSFQFQSGSNVGFAIPINSAISIARQIEAGNFTGNIHRGATAYLGVEVRNSGYYQNGSYLAGVVVVGVVPGSAAETAGLSYGDVITSLNAKTITSPTQLVNMLLAMSPGTKVTLNWVDQYGTAQRTVVKLTSGPPQ
jgi:S1-C subfamily serine protease